MYLNNKLIHNKNFNLQEVFCMQLLKQNRNESLEDYLAMYFNDDIIEKFEKQDILDKVKKKKKSDSDFSTFRLSKKGQDLLSLFETPEIEVGDDNMFNYLCEMYLNNDDTERVIGNKKKTRMYCAIFRKHLNLSLHEMFWLCSLFLERYEYTKRLEFIFFNSNKNRYGTFEANIEESPLYQFLDENRQEVEKLWRNKIKDYEAK